MRGWPRAKVFEVGAVGKCDLDLDEDVARAGLGPRNFLDAQVAGAVEAERLHRPLSYEDVAVKLHRCRFTWMKIDRCSRVQSALDEMDIEYELVIWPISRRKREAMVALSGQKYYPVIEFEDGSVYREDLKDMAATIRAGKLDEKRGSAAAAG